MAQNHFRAQLLKSAAVFWKAFGIPNLKNWCLVASLKASQKESAKSCGKGSTFYTLDLPKLREGSQKSWFQGIEKKFPKGPGEASVWEADWYPKSPKSHKSIPHVEGLVLVSFSGGCQGLLIVKN